MSKATIASVPGAEEREVWQKSGRSAKLATSGNPTVGCYCFATHDLTCVPLWVNSTDADLTTELVQMELEKRRLNSIDAGVSHDFRIVAKQGPRSQVEISLIPPDTKLEKRDLDWTFFDAAPRVYVLPKDQLILWKEEGQWVAAFSKKDKLAYYHPLGVADLDEDVVSELQLLYLTLQQKELVGELTGVTIWEQNPESNSANSGHLESGFDIPVACEEQPPPDFQRVKESKLEPPDVARKRLKAANRKRSVIAAAIVAAIYALLLFTAIFRLHSMDQGNREKNARLLAVEPEVSVIRDVKSRWEALRPAVDPTLYPLDLFHHSASLLPPRGVRITHFEVKGEHVIIKGEATTLALAIDYQDKLIQNENLNDYSWNGPPPGTNQSDNRAHFHVNGVYRYGQAQ